MQISVSGVLVNVVDLDFYSSWLRDYMVDKNGTVRGNSLSFSSNPKIHDSRSGAETEVLRLAQTNSGTRFAVCEVVSTVRVGEVDWEKA